MRIDEQYGQQLGVQLRQETADLEAAPDLVQRLRRRHARRSRTIRAVIATPVAAAAAAVILVAMPGQGAPDRTQHTNGDQVQLQSASYVQRHTVTALGQASQYVMYAKSTFGSGYYETWTDKATERYRNDVYTSAAPAPPALEGAAPAPEAQGELQAPLAPGRQTTGPIRLSQSHGVSGPNYDQTIITVDYDQKVWFQDRAAGGEPVTGVDITDVDSVRKAIDDGTVKLLGQEKVGGVDTLHLRLTGPDSSYQFDMWVDSTTYLPVQQTETKGDGEAIPASATVTTTYNWLPRTEENLAHLVLTPPPGFAQVK